jgi:3D (Asp-Asp-Asp) domain-containing protein
MITRIHVNGQNLRMNKKNKQGKRKPVFTVKDYKTNRKGNMVDIHGPSILVYRPDNPLNSAAVAWIETEAEVDVYA